MQYIKIRDTDGVITKNLPAGYFGQNAYENSPDFGRVYVGTGNENLPLAFLNDIQELAFSEGVTSIHEWAPDTIGVNSSPNNNAFEISGNTLWSAEQQSDDFLYNINIKNAQITFNIRENQDAINGVGILLENAYITFGEYKNGTQQIVLINSERTSLGVIETSKPALKTDLTLKILDERVYVCYDGVTQGSVPLNYPSRVRGFCVHQDKKTKIKFKDIQYQNCFTMGFIEKQIVSNAGQKNNINIVTSLSEPSYMKVNEHYVLLNNKDLIHFDSLSNATLINTKNVETVQQVVKNLEGKILGKFKNIGE